MVNRNERLRRLEHLERQGGPMTFRVWYRTGDRMRCDNPPADLSLAEFAMTVPESFTFTLDKPQDTWRGPYARH